MFNPVKLLVRIKRLNWLMAIACSIVFCKPVSGQTDRYQFSHVGIQNGLSDNHVNCVFKDKKGFVWFGTTFGLNRFDGYTFKIYKHDPRDKNSLAKNHVVHIFEGPEDKLWIICHGAISVYDPVTDKFSNDIGLVLSHYHVPGNNLAQIKKGGDGSFWFIMSDHGVFHYKGPGQKCLFYGHSGQAAVKLCSDSLMDVCQSDKKNAWLLYTNGVIEKLDLENNRIAATYRGIQQENLGWQFFKMTGDKNGNLWVYSDGAPIGAYCYHPANGTLLHYHSSAGINRLNADIINNIVQADDGKMWLGTDHGGINVIDPSTGAVSYILNRVDDPNSLQGNSVNLYKDNTGVIWVGTFKEGVNFYYSNSVQFPLFTHFASDPGSLPFEDVNCFAQAANGNIWIGTNGGGLIYFDRKRGTFRQYKHSDLDPKSLASNIVISLCMDHLGELWIGTYYGGLDRFDGETFDHYRHSSQGPASITDDRVYSIIEDSKNKLWVGTFAGGLNILDRAKNNFMHPKYKSGSDYTAVICEGKDHFMWIARDNGLDKIDLKTTQLSHYAAKSGQTDGLVGNDINAIKLDSKGLLWVGTKDGLTVMDPATKQFTPVNSGCGYPESDVSNIVEDKQGYIWVSSNNGLARIKLDNRQGNYHFHIKKFNEADGLQGRDFNINAALRLANGELIFGGPRGFNLFDPAKVNDPMAATPLGFTDLEIFNRSVNAGDTVNGRVILSKSISSTSSLTLSHDDNVFSIEFAAFNFFFPDKIKYQYMLEGFDKDWISSPASRRKVTYTNLDRGDYVFKVRTLNQDMPGAARTLQLRIKVLPPFWKTTLAYIVYIGMLAGILLYIRHRGILKIKHRFEIRQAKLDAERQIANQREESYRLRQLDLMKIRFFTNVSHEFRTPLSLILSPIEGLIRSSTAPRDQEHLLLIKRNGRRLLNLVNQLLDFRKMEYKEIKLNLQNGDILLFIKDIFLSFSDMAAQKGVQYIFDGDAESFVANFDHDKLERILFNLLSNAFKFTPSGGHVSLIAGIAANDEAGDSQTLLSIQVIDTGIGISKENQEKIFDHFFQGEIPESLLNQGSGIGLSITREFVKIHGGTIVVESDPGYGSCFTIKLPLVKASLLPETLATATSEAGAATQRPISRKSGKEPAKKSVILLVEDDEDLRFYLKDNLKQDFHVVEAVNGKDGWQKALSLHPELIVSDIHMPEVNGFDMCRKIKSDTRTMHIPVILLTALNGEEDQLAGLTCGASDYILKPFNVEILLSKIHNLWRMQATIKNTYKKQIEIQGAEAEIVSEDEKFVKHVYELVETNLTNSNFSVEELSRLLNVSRVSLYKKLLALTGKTPVDFIRSIRLKKSLALLEKSKLSITNVAYEVGFSNSAYFAKVFKEEYHLLPSEYISSLQDNKQVPV